MILHVCSLVLGDEEACLLSKEMACVDWQSSSPTSETVS